MGLGDSDRARTAGDGDGAGTAGDGDKKTTAVSTVVLLCVPDRKWGHVPTPPYDMLGLLRKPKVAEQLLANSHWLTTLAI